MKHCIYYLFILVFTGRVTLYVKSSGFICDSGCPYRCLTDGPVEQRLSTKENKLILLNYLLSELQAARITAAGAARLNNDFSNISTSDAVLSRLYNSFSTTNIFYCIVNDLPLYSTDVGRTYKVQN